MLALLRVLIGGALLILGGAQLATSAWLVNKGVLTEGTVSSNVDYGIGYAPVIDYKTPDGRYVRIESRIRPKTRGIDGEVVRLDFAKLHYDPQTPSLAILDDPADMWIWPGTLLVVGVMIVALGPLARLVWGD
jgi:hypothetical protein